MSQSSTPVTKASAAVVSAPAITSISVVGTSLSFVDSLGKTTLVPLDPYIDPLKPQVLASVQNAINARLAFSARVNPTVPKDGDIRVSASGVEVRQAGAWVRVFPVTWQP